MVRCRPITLGQSEPTRPDSTAHHCRQSLAQQPVERMVELKVEAGEIIVLIFVPGPSHRMNAPSPGARLPPRPGVSFTVRVSASPSQHVSGPTRNSRCSGVAAWHFAAVAGAVVDRLGGRYS